LNCYKNICSRCDRLGLVPLAYLWKRDQDILLQEMIDSGMNAILIKVAALGLDPVKHLGMNICQVQPHLRLMVRIMCEVCSYMNLNWLSLFLNVLKLIFMKKCTTKGSMNGTKLDTPWKKMTTAVKSIF